MWWHATYQSYSKQKLNSLMYELSFCVIVCRNYNLQPFNNRPVFRLTQCIIWLQNTDVWLTE